MTEHLSSVELAAIERIIEGAEDPIDTLKREANAISHGAGDRIAAFADACVEWCSRSDLEAGGAADEADLREWNLTEPEWRTAIFAARLELSPKKVA